MKQVLIYVYNYIQGLNEHGAVHGAEPETCGERIHYFLCFKAFNLYL